MREVTIGVKKAARQVVEDVRAEHARRAAVPVYVVALIGLPAKVLLGKARDADLLVLGSRGRGGLRNASATCGSSACCTGQVRSTIVRPEKHTEQRTRPATPRLSVGILGGGGCTSFTNHLAARHGAQHIASGHDPDQLAVVDYRD